MGQFVVVEDRCHEAVVPAPLVPVELDCLAYTGSRKYPRIPHQCHFGHPPSVISSAARIFARKPRFLSRSLSPSFEAGSFEMTRGWILSHTKRSLPTRPLTHGAAMRYYASPMPRVAAAMARQIRPYMCYSPYAAKHDENIREMFIAARSKGDREWMSFFATPLWFFATRCISLVITNKYAYGSV